MAHKSLRKGIFITFEGPEGCGKSTQSGLLYEYLKKSYTCLYTREPGGTRTGEKIREILLHSKSGKITDLTELLLFEANRSQIVDEVIRPAMGDKKIVICDRFSDATLAYQGYGGKLPLKIVETIDGIARGGTVPDLTILLDIQTDVGLRRAKAKGADRIESKEISYHKRVRSGYLKLAKKYPDRIKVIKVVNGIPETQRRVRCEAEVVIQKYKRSR